MSAHVTAEQLIEEQWQWEQAHGCTWLELIRRQEAIDAMAESLEQFLTKSNVAKGATA